MSQSSVPSSDDVDLLYGVPRIAAAMGLTEPQARHLCERGTLPTFKLPGSKMICARRSTLTAWLAAQEARSAHRPRGDRNTEGAAA